MIRSLGFGSKKENYIRFRICFRCAFIRLSLLTFLTRWFMIQKVLCNFIYLRYTTNAYKFSISSAFHSLFYTSAYVHISLTVLMRYRSFRVFFIEGGTPIYMQRQDFHIPSIIFKFNIRFTLMSHLCTIF